MECYNEMLAAAREFGLKTTYLNIDGDLHRTRTIAKPNSRNGWYVGDPNGTWLVMGDWQTCTQQAWRPDCGAMSYQDKLKLKLAHYALMDRKAEQQKKAIAQCHDIWKQSIQAHEHPYLTIKNIQGHNARIDRHGNLVVRICCHIGRLISLQFISPTGAKRFKGGCSLKGGSTILGKISDTDIVLVCEGYATGCSLHEATNLPVVIAFNANNLEPVCKAISLAYPSIKLIICADNDHQSKHKTGVNVGLDKARIVAKKLNVTMLWPEFKLDNDGSDFNDIHCQQGLEVLTNMLKPAINRGL